MTHYEQAIDRVQNTIYRNQLHIDKVIALRRYLREHYSEPVSLSRLAHQLFVSKFHLHRLFKRYYGQTPLHYLTEIRIHAAKKLLQEGLSVRETCMQVGFNSVGSFSVLFKRKVGKPPAQYQKEQHSR